MSRWIGNNIADRLYILDHVSSWKNITPESVEKDWWVTAVLMQKMPFVVLQLQLQLQSQSVSPDSAHSLIP